MTILTYSLNLDQTGSVVLESEEQLFTYINNFDENELFTVSYPITAVTAGEVTTTIASDSELQNSVQECMDHENEMEEAEDERRFFFSISFSYFYILNIQTCVYTLLRG